MIRLSTLLALVIAATAAPGVAQQSVTVSYAGLDLASAPGVQILQRRVDQAITTVCGRPSAMDLHALSLARQCREETSVRTSRQVSALTSNANFAANTRGEAIASSR